MDRATTPVVAVALLVALTVMAASVVGVAALALDTPTAPTQATVALSVDASADRLVFIHRGGSVLDTTHVSLLVTVEGDRLTHQPPVPFFAAAGFRSGPAGPYNSGADPRWRAGERASFALASTNAPAIEAGDTVSVTLSENGQLVAKLSSRAD